MSGLKLTLPVAFTDTSLPVLRDDPLLTAGSLLLFDPIHEANPITGIPADGAVVPNIAQREALAVLGSSSSADAQLTMKLPASFTGTAGKFERTGKGGFHGISPQGGTAIGGGGPAVALPLPLISWVLAHPTHDYYASVWGRQTRFAAAAWNNSTWWGICGTGQQTNSMLVWFGAKTAAAATMNFRPSSGTGKNISYRQSVPATGVLGNSFANTGSHGWQTMVGGVQMADPQSLPGDNTNGAITGAYAGGIIAWGSAANVPGIGSTGASTTTATIDATGVTGNKDKADSHIIYRVYLEDLTVSGRTYAAVDALDFAQYTADVATVGGRYYGDTFTDPTTIP